MATSMSFGYFCVFAIVFALFISLRSVSSTNNGDEVEEEFDNLFTLPLEHSLGSDGDYSKCGFITIRSMTNNLAQFTQATSFTTPEKDKLKKLAQGGGLYRFRVPVKYNGNEPVAYVSSFIKACSLYESRLSEEITLNVDSAGHVVGVSAVAFPSVCRGVDIDYEYLNDFNTTIEIRQSAQGPQPDTQSYVQKMEQEKVEKTKGEQSDNRSFLAKYWMYIVPVVLILMVASASDPGQGGGR